MAGRTAPLDFGGGGTRVPTPSSGSWPRPRASIYRAVTSFSEPWRENLESGRDRGGGRRHPTHLKSRSRPWLWLVKRMKASIAPTHGHASYPSHSWVLWGAAGPRGKSGSGQPRSGRDRVSPPTRGRTHLRKRGFLGFRWGPEVVVTRRRQAASKATSHQFSCSGLLPPRFQVEALSGSIRSLPRASRCAQVPMNPTWNAKWSSQAEDPEVFFWRPQASSFPCTWPYDAGDRAKPILEGVSSRRVG